MDLALNNLLEWICYTTQQTNQLKTKISQEITTQNAILKSLGIK